MPTLYSMVNETGNRNRILEMCEFLISFRLGIASTILPDFNQILHKRETCGRFDGYCLRDKPEVVPRF